MLLVTGAVAGCAELERSFDRLTGSSPHADRSPGVKPLLTPAEVEARENCTALRPPYARFDLSEVVPPQVPPGGTISHRVIYTLCPDARESPVRGRLSTTISLGYKRVFADAVAGFQLQPGQWIIDADIVLPPAAKPGSYVLETEFRGGGVMLGDTTTFVVLP